MNKKDYAAIALILTMTAISAHLYGQMPEQITVHWNAAGEADGYSSKGFGLFMLPAVTAAIYGFFLLIPKIEVFKENIKSFMQYFDNIKLLFVAFMLAIHAASLAQNIGYKFNMNSLVLPAVALLFYYIGHAMPHMKRNFFIGIRTPWTLANESVWNRTHQLGGKTFKANAVIILLSALAPGWGMLAVVASAIANAVLLFAYSYWLYQKENKNDLR